MAGRIGRAGDMRIDGIWKLPDNGDEPRDGLISISLPHPFVGFPTTYSYLVPTVSRKLPALILSPRGGSRFPFDAGLIRPTTPPAIRNEIFRKIIQDALREQRKPRPVIKDPPKEKDGTKKARTFAGVMTTPKAKKNAPGLPGPSHAMTISAMAMGRAVTFAAPLAITMSAATFLMG